MDEDPNSIVVVGGADFFGKYVTNTSFLGDTFTKVIIDGKPAPIEPTHFRWMWLDRFTAFESGKLAKSQKNVALTDEPVDLYLPSFPMLPCSLVVEGFALTGGILVSEVKNFEEQVVLAKVNKAIFHRPALAGDRIEYSTEILDVKPRRKTQIFLAGVQES